jgi:hypothetical protein
MLRVIGRWLGVRRVGVLNGPGLLASFPGGVDGRAHGLQNNAETKFSLPDTSFGVRKSGAVCTMLIDTSPRTLGTPSFLGEGNSRRRVDPRSGGASSASSVIGLLAVPRLVRERVDPGWDPAWDCFADDLPLPSKCEASCASRSSTLLSKASTSCEGASNSASFGETSCSPASIGSVAKYASDVWFSCASLFVRPFLEREPLLPEPFFLRSWPKRE